MVYVLIVGRAIQVRLRFSAMPVTALTMHRMGKLERTYLSVPATHATRYLQDTAFL